MACPGLPLQGDRFWGRVPGAGAPVYYGGGLRPEETEEEQIAIGILPLIPVLRFVMSFDTKNQQPTVS